MTLDRGFALRASIEGDRLFLTYGGEDVVKSYDRSFTVCELERDIAAFLTEQIMVMRIFNRLVFGNYFVDKDG